MNNKACPKNCLGNCKECELDEKKLKAFEIIKDKNVDVHWVKICENSKEYNEEKNIWEIELTQEEFNLLKEVLL